MIRFRINLSSATHLQIGHHRLFFFPLSCSMEETLRGKQDCIYQRRFSLYIRFELVTYRGPSHITAHYKFNDVPSSTNIFAHGGDNLGSRDDKNQCEKSMARE